MQYSRRRQIHVLDRHLPRVVGKRGDRGQIERLRPRDVVVSTGRRRGGERGQAAADVSTRHQRDAPIRGRQADLAAHTGAGQPAHEELGEDRCSGDGDRAAAVVEELLGVAVGDRVTERRSQVGVETAQRNDVARHRCQRRPGPRSDGGGRPSPSHRRWRRTRACRRRAMQPAARPGPRSPRPPR